MTNREVIEQLQKQILNIQGNLRPSGQQSLPLGLGQIESVLRDGDDFGLL